jgi:hypothetical protein
MSLEMAHKVIVPQKKIMSRSFLNSGTLIVNFLPYVFFPSYGSAGHIRIGPLLDVRFISIPIRKNTVFGSYCIDAIIIQ